MQEYNIDDAEDTLSLSNFLMQDDSEQVSEPNHHSSSCMSTSSSSSSSLSEHDFLGFFTEECNRNTSYMSNYSSGDIVFCGKVVSSKCLIAGDRKPEANKSQINTLFRSSSDSFKFIRLRSASRSITSRLRSMPNKSGPSFLCKSRLMVFMFGSGSSKFPTKVDMSVIKSRQLRQQSTSTVSMGRVDGGTSGKKLAGWWRLVDVLGCSGTGC